MDAWMHGCMDAWIHGYMDTWIHGWMHAIGASLGFSLTRLIINERFMFMSLKVEKLLSPLFKPFVIIVQIFRSILVFAKSLSQ
jgi:hypothetical protein